MVTATELKSDEQLIGEMHDIEKSLYDSHTIDQDFYEVLLELYWDKAIVLMGRGNDYPLMRALDIKEDIDTRGLYLESMDDNLFDDYIILGDLYACLTRPV